MSFELLQAGIYPTRLKVGSDGIGWALDGNDLIRQSEVGGEFSSVGLLEGYRELAVDADGAWLVTLSDTLEFCANGATESIPVTILTYTEVGLVAVDLSGNVWALVGDGVGYFWACKLAESTTWSAIQVLNPTSLAVAVKAGAIIITGDIGELSGVWELNSDGVTSPIQLSEISSFYYLAIDDDGTLWASEGDYNLFRRLSTDEEFSVFEAFTPRPIEGLACSAAGRVAILLGDEPL